MPNNKILVYIGVEITCTQDYLPLFLKKKGNNSTIKGLQEEKKKKKIWGQLIFVKKTMYKITRTHHLLLRSYKTH